MTEDRGARLTARATLVAAVIALVASVLTNVFTVTQESRREDTQAKGAARVLMGELLLASNDMADLGVEGRLRPFGSEYPVALPPSDLRLIASRLDTEEWNDVATTLSDVANLDRLVRSRFEREGRTPLPPNITASIGDDLGDLCDAMEALQALAEVEGIACRTLGEVSRRPPASRVGPRRGTSYSTGDRGRLRPSARSALTARPV